MLMIARKEGESIIFYDKDSEKFILSLVITEVDRNIVRIGIEAPNNISVFRTEITPKPLLEKYIEENTKSSSYMLKNHKRAIEKLEDKNSNTNTEDSSDSGEKS